MIDFTSALYLGMKHSSTELNGWEQLTTGVPAILNEPSISLQVSKYVARMQGLEEGIAAPSTLHIYSDLFELLKKKRIVLFIDEKIYPVSKYGIEKLQSNQARVQSFRHFDAAHLNALVKANVSDGVTPVIMSDGWCPLCGKAAPIQKYISSIRQLNGTILIDDTQAFGILGEHQHEKMPYGKGGGGILKWLNIHDDSIVTVTSLAKAFGVPMAVIGGTSAFIAAFKESSRTRIHSSPVSIVHLQAALNAFRANYNKGDLLRNKLWQNICLFKNKINQKTVLTGGGIFPVQNTRCRSSNETIRLYERLKKNKISTVLLSLHNEHIPVISFIIRPDHTPGQIMELVSCIHSFSLKTSY
jgi:8-amino-7-oxononanoate synthase